MKFIPTLIIFVFTIFTLTNSETTYSGFTITSADPNNPCSISVPQTDVGTKCISVCGQGNIDIAAVSGQTNQYTVNGYSPTDQCTESTGGKTLNCGTPVTAGAFSIDCTPVAAETTAATTAAATTAAATTAATTGAATTGAATTGAATTGAATTGAATTGAATTGAATTTTGAATTGAATTTTAASTTTGASSTIVVPIALIIVSLLLSVITL
ncbi:hypothetical protein ACTFIY_008217 [Dictyostelium cf. discoideum]